MGRLSGNRSGRTVLIVEDDEVLRMVLRLEFERHGLQVREASNGYAALASIIEARPDIIITDIEMPVMNGFSFIEEVRKVTGPANMPIFAISASKIAGVAEKAVAAGANRFYEKPFTAKTLLAEVDAFFASVNGRPRSEPGI